MLFYCPRCKEGTEEVSERALMEGLCEQCKGQLYAGVPAIEKRGDELEVAAMTFEPFANVPIPHHHDEGES